jgi:lipopolysaccharide transport system ATP-binding protein
MSDIVIRAESLGKRYRIGEREPYLALRDILARAVSAPARLFKPRKPSSPNGDPTHIWALKDVSFEVRQGEVVGIIGRNGAGKSTLLKILARVTMPTEGFAEVRGRIGSLLEVGTGFHPELTGRENTYLNGAILGMSRAEIQRKFDEIVAFAEIEKFIDTPVKYYSTGMSVRLAFSVAAHLQPEILLVDEVLAVGDFEFQKKCLGRMSGIARSGRTVVFVSHNMQAVEALTSVGILVDQGNVVHMGPVSETVALYLSRSHGGGCSSLSAWPDRSGDGEATVESLTFTDSDGVPREMFRPGEEIRVVFVVRTRRRMLFDVAFALETGTNAAIFASHLSDSLSLDYRSGRFNAVATIRPNHLRHGPYCISFGLYSPDFRVCHDECLHYPAFDIVGHSQSVPADRRWGPLFFPFQWQIRS